MSKDKYKSAVDKVIASESFKKETLLLLEKEMDKKKKGSGLRMMNKPLIAIAACTILGLSALALTSQTQNEDYTNVSIDNEQQGELMADVAVNIEGIITEVAEDGKSFKLDNGLWVHITDETELGINGPTAAPKDEQFFEDTFRVGNSIAGFTENDLSSDRVTAYAIYTNWNWDNPIEK